MEILVENERDWKQDGELAGNETGMKMHELARTEWEWKCSGLTET